MVKPAARRRPRATVRRRQLRISLASSDFSELNQFAEAAGVTAEQAASVWTTEKIGEIAASRALRGFASAEAGTDEGKRPSKRHAKSGSTSAAGPLHEEIVAVLASSSTPMTVSEIAAEIRRRGQYFGPRTGQPVSPEVVGRRVSNPHYRPLFVRRGRLLALAAGAGAEPRQTGGD